MSRSRHVPSSDKAGWGQDDCTGSEGNAAFWPDWVAIRRGCVAPPAYRSRMARIGSASLNVSTSTSGLPPRRVSADVCPVGTATHRAPIARPQVMSLSVSPMTITSPIATPVLACL